MIIDQEKMVYIPHIDYTVYLLDDSKSEGVVRVKFQNGSDVVAEKVNAKESIIYINLPATDKDIGVLSHDIVHVLQYIEEDYGAKFDKEKEHYGYISQFIWDSWLGI